MGSSRKPVVLVVLVNVDRARPLPHVVAEGESIRAALREVAEVRVLENPTADELLGVLRKDSIEQRIRVFHFAGHANAVSLTLANAAGDPVAGHATGLADYLGQHGLALVVLNGCSTRTQIERLRSAGVDAVVATTKAIKDHVGASFAALFYAELANKRLVPAFEAAKSAVQISWGSDLRTLVDDEHDVEEWGDPKPWVISNDAKMAGWRLPRVDERLLVDELAQVFNDPDMARVVVSRVGFPPGLIPGFATPLVFWHEVVTALGNGVLEPRFDGIQELIDVAASMSPGHPFFDAHRTQA